MEPYSGTVMAIDSSGRGSDLTGYAVVKQLNGNLFLMDCGGFAGGYEGKTLEALANKAKQYGVNEVIVEANFGDGMFTHLLEPVLEAMNACGSLEWTRQRAEEEADKAIAALQVLPDTPWREALIGLAHIAVQRDR